MVHGLAGSVDLPFDCPTFQGVVAEVLGHLASLEGYVRTLRDLGARYRWHLQTVVKYVPNYFGSVVVPLSLEAPPETLRIVCLCPKVLLAQGLPFSKLQCPPTGDVGPDGVLSGHKIVEFYRSRQVVLDGAAGNPPVPQVCSCVWVVEETWSLSAFGTYVIFGDSKGGPFVTSNQELNGPSGGWYNLIFPLKQPVVCGVGYAVYFTFTSHTVYEREDGRKGDPWYEVQVQVVKEWGQLVVDYYVQLEYRDVICEVFTYDEWKKSKYAVDPS